LCQRGRWSLMASSGRLQHYVPIKIITSSRGERGGEGFFFDKTELKRQDQLPGEGGGGGGGEEEKELCYSES